MRPELLQQIGKRLRRIRESLAYTREQFAEEVGISPQFLAEIENGKKGMSADTLYKICMRFDLSADHILLGRGSLEELKQMQGASLQNHSWPAPYVSLAEDILAAIAKNAPTLKP